MRDMRLPWCVIVICLTIVLPFIVVSCIVGEQQPFHVVDELIAVYPDGNTEDSPDSYWATASTQTPLTVTYTAYYKVNDDRWYVHGKAEELPDRMLVIVLNKENNHGVIAMIVTGSADIPLPTQALAIEAFEPLDYWGR